MSLNHALFGDEYAMSAIEQMISNNTGEIISDDNQPESFDEKVNDNVQKISRRKRKSSPDDVQLIAEQYQKTKDVKLWLRLQERLYRPLLKYINGVTKNQMIAEDAVAQAWARANERIDEYDASKSKFSTWLWTISYRQCLYDMKIDARIDTISYDVEGFAEFDNTGDNYIYGGASDNLPSSIDYYIIDNPKTGQITEMNASDIIKKLYDVSVNVIAEIKNPVTKSVIEMKLIKDATIKDISEALDMNQSNVKNHLYKGKSELASKIKREYPDLYELYLDALVEADNNNNLVA